MVLLLYSQTKSKGLFFFFFLQIWVLLLDALREGRVVPRCFPVRPSVPASLVYYSHRAWLAC